MGSSKSSAINAGCFVKTIRTQWTVSYRELKSVLGLEKSLNALLKPLFALLKIKVGDPARKQFAHLGSQATLADETVLGLAQCGQ